MRTKRVLLASALGLLLSLSVLGGSAEAVALACGSGSTCLVDLQNSNIDGWGLNTGAALPIDISVRIDNTGATTVLGFKYISGPASIVNLPKATMQIAWNPDGLTLSATNPSGDNAGLASWSDGAGQADGFGYFQHLALANGLGNDTVGITDYVNFTLNSLVTSFTEATKSSGNQTLITGSHFAVKMQFFGLAQPDGSSLSCSGWVGDGPNSSIVSQDTGCSTAVPEPGTLALVGSGLVGLGVVVRKRLLRRTMLADVHA